MSRQLSYVTGAATHFQTGMVTTRRQARPIHIRVGQTTFRFVVFGLLFILSWMYLHQALSKTSQAARIADLNDQVRSLEHDARQLDSERASGQALSEIEQSSSRFELQKTDRPDFVITPSGELVAGK